MACASRKATRADAPAMATASVLQGSAAAGAQPLVAAAAAGACRCHDTQRSAETHQLSGATLTLAASAAAPAPAGTGWRRRWTACLASPRPQKSNSTLCMPACTFRLVAKSGAFSIHLIQPRRSIDRPGRGRLFGGGAGLPGPGLTIKFN